METTEICLSVSVIINFGLISWILALYQERSNEAMQAFNQYHVKAKDLHDLLKNI